MMKDKISRYLGLKYPTLRNAVGDEGIRGLVEATFESTMYAIDDDQIVGVAIWMQLDDEAIDFIENGVLSVEDPEDIKILMEMKGNNYHMLCLAVDDKSYFYEGMKKLIKDKSPDSLSWFRDKKFFYRRCDV